MLLYISYKIKMMDDRQHIFDCDINKICVVLNITDMDKYFITLNSLKKVKIPVGKKLELCEIFDAENIGIAYNQAIMQSNAKYKIYIKVGTAVLNEDLFVELIDLFETEYKTGIVGVSGYEYVPITCDIRDTRLHYGKIYNSSNEKYFDWIISENAFREVSFLDSYFIATQYDILWEELYDSAYFSVMAQCMKFKQDGYTSVVLNTGKYDVGISTFDIDFLPSEVAIFKDKYYKVAFPLVSILIPTHNRPEYLKIALESAINQTYRNIEILISDDSDDNRTYEIVQEYLNQDDRIKYFYHKGLSSMCNHNILSDQFSGEYISWLMDDDILEHSKLEKMIDYYREYDNVKLVTSYRNFINACGDIVDLDVTKIKINSVSIFEGISVIKQMIKTHVNFIGEPSTVLLCAKYLKPINKIYLSGSKYQSMYYRKTIQWDIGTTRLYGMTDMMTWFAMLQDGALVFIPERLSSFRMHDGQGQKSEGSLYIAQTFISMVLVLHKLYYENKLSDDEYFDTLQGCYETECEWFSHPNLNSMTFDGIDYSEAYLICRTYSKKELESKQVIDIFSIYDF